MTINKYLAYFIVGGLFLALFIPFIVSTSMFFPFITGKNFAFRIITELIFGAWIILALRDPLYRPRFSWLAGAVTIFVALIGIADLLSVNPFKSFWSNFERMEGYITLLHLFAYFVVASSVLRTEMWWTRFFQTSVGASVIMGIYGILQLAGKITINQGGVRLDGTLGNASYLAAFMLINFFLTLFLLVRSRHLVAWRYIYGVIMVLQFFILYHTATRGAMLGLLGGIILMALILVLASREKVVRISGGITLAVLALIIVLVVSLKHSPLVQSQPSLARLTSISTDEAGPRFMVWGMAWQGFKERPIFGWGQESFNYVFNKYYNPAMYAQEQWFDRTHNVIFDWLIAGGALGLISYLSILLFALYYLWKQGDATFSVGSCLKKFFSFTGGESIPHLAEKAVLTGFLLAYLFQNLFVFDNITSYLLFFALLAYLHSMSGRPIKRLSEERLRINPAVANRVIAPIALVATVFVLYVLTVTPIRASTTLIDALRPQQEGPGKNLEYFKAALAYQTFGDSEIREQLSQKAVEVIYAPSIDLNVKQQYYDLAREELKKQIEKTPHDARYELFLGSFLNRARNYDEAVEHLKRALELSPKKQTIMFELGSAYLNQGKYPEALALMKSAFELDEHFVDARLIYAVAAVYTKDVALAKTLMQSLSSTTLAYDPRLVQAYGAVGQHQTAIALLEQHVAREPSDPQARFSLAAGYLGGGQRVKAVEVLRTVAAEFPAQKEQAEYYIREIQAGRNP